MISMFLDTSNSHLLLGIYKAKKQIYWKDLDVKNDLSNKTLSLINKAFNELNISLKDLKAIYVVNGPGSFTGIRVGVSIVKTLAWSLNIKAYEVSELELFSTTEVDTDYIIPMIDARRGYVYGAIYDKNGNTILEDNYIEKEKLLNRKEIKKATIISYDSFDNSILPNINFTKLLKNKKFKSVKPHSLNPNYLKKTEAEEKNDKRN